MPRRRLEKAEPRASPLKAGPWIAVCICCALAAIALLIVRHPKLVAVDPATKALGIAPTTTLAQPTASREVTATTLVPSATTTTQAPPTAPSPDSSTTTPSGGGSAPRQSPITTTLAPTTTTTTALSPTTTTPPATYTGPHIETVTQPGSLGYPDPGVISSTYPVSTTGGVVEGRGTWSGVATLTITVTCPGGTPTGTKTGGSGLSASATCGAGTATVEIQESGTTTVSYTLTISYPAS